MLKLIVVMLLCSFPGIVLAQTVAEDPSSASAELSAEDLKIVAELETLQLLDLAEDLDMLKDINYLIEDDQNEIETK